MITAMNFIDEHVLQTIDWNNNIHMSEFSRERDPNVPLPFEYQLLLGVIGVMTQDGGLKLKF